MQYGYNSGTNNGQVASTTDNISGQTVQYMYDQLQRLIQAYTTSGGTQWGDSYTYDGFGNLTGKNVTQGSAPAVSFSYDPGTNQPINQYYGNPNFPPSSNYDANGNAPVGTWDAENHLVQQTLDGVSLSWVYDPSGKRVAQFQQMSGYGQWTFYVYGATGQLVGQIGCNLYSNQTSSTCAAQRANVYFGGRLIARMESQSGTMVTNGVVTDRLGTVRAVQTSSGWSTPSYYPYGETMTAGGVAGQEQYATYVRDSTASSQDYAMQRYYSNNTGRFYSPDPLRHANLSDPQSWNQYAYAREDPVNASDPSGMDPDNPSTWPPGSANYWSYFCWDSGSESVPNTTCFINGIQTQGNSKKKFLHVANPSKSGPHEQRIDAVLGWIAGNIDPTCADWLTGVGDAIAGLVGDPTDPASAYIGHGTFDNTSISAFTGYDPTETNDPPGYAITVNDTGAFFVGTASDGASLSVGGYAGGTSQAQVMILLHELAHLLGAAGFQDDYGNTLAGNQNNALVKQNCQGTLNAAKNIP